MPLFGNLMRTGLSMFSPGGVKNIVRKGLELWYKGDKTQPPLGEEKVINGRFLLGPEIITNSDFSTSGSIDNNSHTLGFQNSGGITGGVTISNSELILVGDTGAREDYGRAFITNGVDSTSVVTSGKTYKFTYTVSSASGTIQFGYHNGGWNEGSLSHTVGTHTYYITQASGTTFIIKNNGDGGILKLSSISLKQTNYNDNWSFKDSKFVSLNNGAFRVDNTTGNQSGGPFQNIGLVVGREYQVSATLKLISSTSESNGAYTVFSSRSAGNNQVSIYTGSSLVNGGDAVTKTFTFTPTEPNNVSIQFSVDEAEAVFEISNVSVKEISNSIRDYSLKGNDGVLHSGIALSFSGDDYIDIDYWKSKAINSNTKAAFAVWFYADDVSTSEFIFGANAGSGINFYLGVHSGKLELGWGSSGWTNDGNSIAVSSNTWYRAVVVVGGLTCRVYLNGELAFSKTNGDTPFTLHSSGISIGCQGDGVGDHYNGKLADFQIYDKAWTASDVAYDYNNPDKDVFDGSSNISPINCTALYRLNEGAGISVVDSKPVLGNIVNINSDFSTPSSLLAGVGHESGWLNAGAAYAGTANISNGQLTLAARASDSKIAFVYATNGSSTSFLNIGSVYQLSYTIDEIVGSLEMDFYSDEGTWKDLTSDQMTVGTHTLIFRAAGTNFAIRQKTYGSIVKLSNIAVREILPTSIYNEDLNGTSLTPSDELVANNSFTADSNWFKGTGWTISGNKALGAAGSTSDLVTLANVVENHTWYDVSVDVLAASGSGAELSAYINQGLNRVQFYANAADGNITSSTVISFKAYSRWDANQASSSQAGDYKDIVIRKNSTAVCEIASISVKKSVWQYTQPYIPQFAASSYSKKLMFNKLDEKVDLGSNVTFAADNEAFTLSFFYQHTSDNVGQAYILQKDTSNYIALNELSNKIYWKLGGNFIGDDAGDYIDIDDLEDFKTHYITITRASGNNPVVKVYINGTLQKTVSASSNQDGAIEYRYIGHNPTHINLSETFFIDEISTFNKELSSSEVQELFNSGQILDARDHSTFLGSEIVDKGDFTGITQAESTNGTDWTTSVGWTISGGKAAVDNSSSTPLTQTSFGVISGKTYNVSFEISDYVSGSCQLQFGGSQVVINRAANGVYNSTVISSVTNTTLYVYGYGNCELKIDNISVKEVKLSGYWRNNGLQTWSDLSPNVNDATVTPHADSLCLYLQESVVKGKDVYGLPMNRVKEKGLQIDSLSYIHTGNTFQDVYRNSFTIQMWLKPQDGNPSGQQYIYGAEDGQSRVAIYLGTNGDIISQFQAGTSSSLVETKPSSSPFSNGLSPWVHVTFVYTEGSNTAVYINGASVAVSDATPPESSFNAITFADATLIGSISYNGADIYGHTALSTSTNQYEGKVDEVKLYSIALTSVQVKQNYDAEKINHSNTSVWSDDFDSSFI